MNTTTPPNLPIPAGATVSAQGMISTEPWGPSNLAPRYTTSMMPR